VSSSFSVVDHPTYAEPDYEYDHHDPHPRQLANHAYHGLLAGYWASLSQKSKGLALRSF
jgi:hypothetical protein